MNDRPVTDSPSDLVSEQLECASAWGEASECTGQVQYRYVRKEGGSTPYCDQHWDEDIALRREQHQADVARRQAQYQATKEAPAARTRGEKSRESRRMDLKSWIITAVIAFFVLGAVLNYLDGNDLYGEPLRPSTGMSRIEACLDAGLTPEDCRSAR